MKKVKIITALSTVACASAAVPIIATACSSNNNNLTLDVSEVKTYLDINCGEKSCDISAFNSSGEKVTLSSITTKGEDAHYLEVNTDGTTLKLKPVAVGATKVAIKGKDNNGNEASTVLTINVVDTTPEYQLYLNTSNIPPCIELGSKDYELTATVGGQEATLEYVFCESSNENVLSASWDKDTKKLTIDGKEIQKGATLTIYAVDSNYNIAEQTVNITVVEKLLDVTITGLQSSVEFDTSMNCTVSAKLDDQSKKVTNVTFVTNPSYAFTADDFIPSTTGDDGTITITAEQTAGTFNVCFVVESGDGHYGYSYETITVTDPIPVRTNTMGYKGQQYTLKDWIDPNCFCATGVSSNILYIPIKGSDKPLEINGETDRADITSVKLQQCDPFVTEISDNFMYAATGLKSLDLSGLGRITKIGSQFLGRCSSLTSIDVSMNRMRNVETIGDKFMYYCNKFTVLDLSLLKKLQSFGSNAFEKCEELTDFYAPLEATPPKVGAWFGYGDQKLTKIHCGQYLQNYKDSSSWGGNDRIKGKLCE